MSEENFEARIANLEILMRDMFETLKTSQKTYQDIKTSLQQFEGILKGHRDIEIEILKGQLLSNNRECMTARVLLTLCPHNEALQTMIKNSLAQTETNTDFLSARLKEMGADWEPPKAG